MPTIKISGVDVNFPFKPYAPQIAMMCKIINALKKKENALIESPTGTGKTLALLCSALAWQQAEYDNAERLLIQERTNFNLAQEKQRISLTNSRTIAQDDDDFVETSKIQVNQQAALENASVSPADLNDPKVFKQRLYEARKSVPKIFFGSRTHKQLIQVIRELNRTEYRGVKMTILGSREQTCIHQMVKQAPDRGEMCKSLLRNEHGLSCPYYQKLKKFENSASQLRKVIKQTHSKFVQNSNNDDFVQGLAWDIEDIVKIGEDQRFCPHFAITSVLMQDAALIFCPYNYLIDPLIRDKVKLEMQGQVILLDEAHNIEDSCRESTSFCVLEEELIASRDAFDAAGNITLSENYPTAAYQAFAELSRNVILFLRRSVEDDKELKQQSHGSYYRLWSGPDIVAQFRQLGITEESYQQFLKYEKDIYDSMETSRSDSRTTNRQSEVELPKISMVAMEQILMFCQFLFKDNCKFMEDFKMTVTKQNPELFDGNAVKKSRRSNPFDSTKPILALKIWCLNPAVAFCDVGVTSWSVILASGTLSPLDTFESELGVAFRKPYRLEAAHVLPPDRMFVRSIGVGPHNKPLRATHQFMYGNEFMDEFGFLLSDVCATVPGGVLCFLPSYRFLDTIEQRWKETGLWKELHIYKSVITEPKGNASLKEAMEAFYEVVDNPDVHSSTCTGALFFAVYRGKISEGLDFADDYARVVVAVGIPYPNFVQTEVQMKREYNNRFASSKKLLKGDQWYEIQAYRALNQALGRCLRHRNDWGSLLLIDERFRNETFRKKLSKWIRASIIHCDQFSQMLTGLKQFTSKLTENSKNGIVKMNGINNPGEMLTPDKKHRLNHCVNDEDEDVSISMSDSKEIVRTVENSWINFSSNPRTMMFNAVATPAIVDETRSKYFHQCQTEEKKRYSFVKRRRFAVFNESPLNAAAAADDDDNDDDDIEDKVVTSQNNVDLTVHDLPNPVEEEKQSLVLGASPVFIGKFSKNRFDSEPNSSSTPLINPTKRKIYSCFVSKTIDSSSSSPCLNNPDFQGNNIYNGATQNI